MIKYSTANRPAFVDANVEVTRPPHPDGLTFGDYLTMKGTTGTDRIFEGDYIVQDDDGVPTEIIRAAAAGDQVERITQGLAKDLKATIRTAIKNLNLTDAQRADLVNRILAVYVLIGDGDLRAAKFMAQNTATGGAFTPGRQTQLVALIDQAILALP